jgi:hypothetical protein
VLDADRIRSRAKLVRAPRRAGTARPKRFYPTQLPALVAACLGIPLGLALYYLGNHGGNVQPPILWLPAVIPGTLIAVTALTAIPARLGAHRPVRDVLRSE